MIDRAKIGAQLSQAYLKLRWLLLLSAWIAVLFFVPVIHSGESPLDEGAARGLLLNWSIYHQIASPIVLLGIPDLRALFFIPVTLYWPGSLVAPRVLWAILVFFAAWMLFAWMRRRLGQEQALLSAGLLLVAPMTITQIDLLGGGAFLLFCLAVGHWMEYRYEKVGRALGGWFYMRFLWAGVTVSVHPAGLAYPLAMIYHWARDKDKPSRLKKQNLIGLAVAMALLLLLQAGWHAVEWLSDPAAALAQIVHSTALDPVPPTWEPWVLGGLALALAALNFRRLFADLFSTALTLALLVGLVAATVDWAYLVFAFLLIWGMDALIRFNDQIPGEGLAAKRGVVLAALVLLSVSFLVADRTYAQLVRAGVPSAHTLLLREVATEVESLGKFSRVLSQWPGQTMVVCKCDVLALPPGTEDPQQFLEWVLASKATHLVFDPRDPDNTLITQDVSMLTNDLRTLFVNEAGVLVGVQANLEEAAEKAAKARAEEELPPPEEEDASGP